MLHPFLSTAAAAAALAFLVGAMPTGHAQTTAGAAVLPTVNMEATVKAAQIDPRRTDDTLTPGARSSVMAVESALQARHLLDASWVDGYFGTKTVEAYAAYQRSLGYTGLDANGLPGRTSLATLGQGRFTVTQVISPGTKVDWDGFTIDERTQSMLQEAQTTLGRHLVLSQGSYNPGGDPTSAGTHDGGGVVDISVQGMSTTTRTRVVRVLRQVGFAAWLRNPGQGDWPWHIHAAAISDTDLSAQHSTRSATTTWVSTAWRTTAPDDGPAGRDPHLGGVPAPAVTSSSDQLNYQ